MPTVPFDERKDEPEMKKIVCILAAVLMFALPVLASAATLESVKNAGTLTMATSPDFPPFENLQPDESIVGIEVDLLNLICEKLGVTLTMKPVDFDSVLPGIIAGKYDVGVSGITITPERQKNADFTVPYCMAAQAIVVVEGSPIAAKADLNGKKISVQTGTTAESYTMAQGYDVKAFTANNDAEMALVNGKVDAWVIDDLTAAEMVATYNEKASKKLVILEEPMTSEPYGLAFAKGSDDLVAAVNEILEELIADGTMAAIFAKFDAPYFSPADAAAE